MDDSQPQHLAGPAETPGVDASPVPLDVYDEMVAGHGHIRPHWQRFIGSAGPLTKAVMDERWDEALRLIRQNGVTYNVYDDQRGLERLWPLDLIPLLLSADEWRHIEAGVLQRARLLDAVAADLYGPQSLLRSGRLPPRLVHGDPGFLRPAHGLRPAGDAWLFLYSADLVRRRDGCWWVLSDRTNTPSGAGYALENRIVTSQVLPDSFRACDVVRLVPFFTAARDGLYRLGARGDDLRAVLLTPGPYNETYFEHAFLARHLGLTLVEGADLLVRDCRVHLKTLQGLEPVDVILRRLDDDFCDPLELRSDSVLGVAGLTQAARSGNVAVCNALGTGILESSALLAFLPSLCRHLLGEDLVLPGAATWWGGHGAGLSHLRAHLDRLVLKPANRGLAVEPVFPADLPSAERASLLERLERRPWDFVGQEPIALSTIPTWENDRLEPRPMTLRVFVARGPDGFLAMPGGLTRLSQAEQSPVVSMQHGGRSKDTWVLTGQRTATADLGRLHPVRRARLVDLPVTRRRMLGADLPSRVADGLFWFGRYAERTEGWVRLLRAVHGRLHDPDQPGTRGEVRHLFGLMAWFGMVPQDLAATGGSAVDRTVRVALHAALFDGQHPNSLRANILRLYRAAHSVRDRLSLDLWRVVAQIDRLSQSAPRPSDLAALLLRLDDLMVSLAALAGLEQESMIRGAGWRFLDIGHRLERTLHGVGLLRGLKVADPALQRRNADTAVLDLVLELFESVMAYRQRYFTTAQWASVLELLVRFDANPRGMAYQLNLLHRHFDHLPEPQVASRAAGGPMEAARTLVAQAREALQRPDLLRAPEPLREVLDLLDATMPDVSNILAHAYFSHAFARSA